MNAHQRRVRGRKGLSGWLKKAPPGEVYGFGDGLMAAFRAHEVGKQEVFSAVHNQLRQKTAADIMSILNSIHAPPTPLPPRDVTDK